MQKRVKKAVTTPLSKQDAETLMGEYAELHAQAHQITASLDERITQIRDEKAPQLQALEDQLKDKFDALQRYAETNPEDFGDRKSIQMAHGKLGFRTGTPKLKVKPKFTWAAITELMKQFMPGYLKTTVVPMKDKLLADRDEDGVATLLDKVGILVAQDEAFYVDLKKEEVPVN